MTEICFIDHHALLFGIDFLDHNLEDPLVNLLMI